MVGGEDGPGFVIGGTACLLPPFPSRGPGSGACVCVFLVRDGRTDRGADAKDERRRPAGKQRDGMYCFCLGGLDLLMPSSQGTRSCGRRGNVPVWQLSWSGEGGGSAGEGRDRDGRNIYACRCVFCTAFYGGTLARYLDTSMIFTHGNCNNLMSPRWLMCCGESISLPLCPHPEYTKSKHPSPHCQPGDAST